MKIGIDYHGVINSNPDFFQKFNASALKNKHDIIILSGSTVKDVEAYLNAHHIAFSGVYSLLDDFKSRGLVQFYEDGSFFVNNEIWNKAKAKYCFDHHVDVHIDDSTVYGAYFQTPFCLYASKPEHCTFIKKSITIDFNQSPEKVLSDLEKNLQKINSK